LKITLNLSVKHFGPISIIPSDLDPKTNARDQLDPSFMYTQLLKNALLDIEHDRVKAMQALVNVLQNMHTIDAPLPATLQEFERRYRPEKAIWWYTKEGFTYQLLNRALRQLEVEMIVDMGFFLQDVHQQISALHQQQLPNYQDRTLTVYRGQGMTIEKFNQLRCREDGLICRTGNWQSECSLHHGDRSSNPNNTLRIDKQPELPFEGERDCLGHAQCVPHWKSETYVTEVTGTVRGKPHTHG
jgi:hypothetical protein